MRRSLILIIVVLLTGACAHTDERMGKSRAKTKIGISYLYSKDCTEALRNFLEAEKEYAEDAELQNALGLAYYCKNEYALAIESYRKAVEYNPDFSDAWNNLGAAYAKSGRYKDAIGVFDKALSNLLYETPELALLNKGDAYAALHDPANATKAYEKAIGMAMAKPQARGVACQGYVRMGKVQYDDKKFLPALRTLQNGIKLCPKEPYSYYVMADVQKKLGNNQEAVKACQAVQQLSPGSYEAQSCDQFIRLVK